MKSLVALLVLAGWLGCEVGCASQPGLMILGPRTVALSPAENSIAITPQLELKNTTKETLGIEHFGGEIDRIKIDYQLTDMAGQILPMQRKVFLGSALAGTRIWVTLLKPGESIRWTPEEALIYVNVGKQKYRLIAHAVLEPPDDIYQIGLSDVEKAEITRRPHNFDSREYVISVH